MAASLLMIGGEFDLSVGSMIGAAGMVIAIPAAVWGWPLWLCILVAFAFAVAVGWANGYLVIRTGLPSFIVTLGFLFILRGLAVIFITHNVHHAYPVGDAFTILKRGASYGIFAKSEVSREDVLGMMAGGQEMEELSAEIEEFARADDAKAAGEYDARFEAAAAAEHALAAGIHNEAEKTAPRH